MVIGERLDGGECRRGKLDGGNVGEGDWMVGNV